MPDDMRALIEPVPIEDDLCTAIAAIEDVGFGARLVLCAEQTSYETRERVLVIKRKIVMPNEAILPALEDMLHFLADGVRRGRGFLRLVK